MEDINYKYPRLYVDTPINTAPISLDSGQVNYLRNVMRHNIGDTLRIFNGKDGEWLSEITELSKKTGIVAPREQIRVQEPETNKVHLLFAPLKKNRMDFIIEKCTELGVTDFHPVITNRTEVRKIKTDRLEAQIIEASEQSERLQIPHLHDLCSLDKKIARWKETEHILGCIERHDAPHISTVNLNKNTAFLIGPVGGFDNDEREMLTVSKKITPVSLGSKVLRAETASMLCVSFAMLEFKQ